VRLEGGGGGVVWGRVGLLPSILLRPLAVMIMMMRLMMSGIGGADETS
jgi:hypothetical protein